MKHYRSKFGKKIPRSLTSLVENEVLYTESEGELEQLKDKLEMLTGIVARLVEVLSTAADLDDDELSEIIGTNIEGVPDFGCPVLTLKGKD